MRTVYPLLFIATILVSESSFSQQLSLSSQYHQNMMTINPAYSGFRGMTNVVASHRSMLTGVAGSPQTTYLSVEGEGKEGKIGLAFIGFHDQTDILSMSSGMGNFVYNAKFGDNSGLRLGLGVGFQNFTVDMAKAKVIDFNDPILFGSLSQNRTALNGEFGAVLHLKGFQLGVAVPQLLSNNPTIVASNDDILNYNTLRHFRGSLKYDIDLNDSKSARLYPLFVVRAANGAPVQWDVSGVIESDKIGWIGVTYHSTYAIAFSAGVRYQGFSVGYAHDFTLGAVNLYSRRSSELILSYQIGNRWKEQEGLNKKLQKELERLEEDLETQGDDLERLEEDLENQGDDTEANEELLKKQKELEDRIKELEKSKANSGGSNITNGTPTAESVRNTFRTAQAIDFADENGAIPPKGFYVVIGAFGVEENAINWKNASIAKGNTNTKLLYNSNLQVREVYMYYSPDREPAMLERRKQYAEYPTVWVQKLE